MASLSKAHEQKKRRKLARMGRQAKAKLNRVGTTPSKAKVFGDAPKTK